MGVLISNETGMIETDIGETIGSQLVDPGRKYSFKTGNLRAYGLGISFKNLHKLKMPRTVQDTVGFTASEALFVTEKELHFSTAVVTVSIISGMYIIVHEITEP